MIDVQELYRQSKARHEADRPRIERERHDASVAAARRSIAHWESERDSAQRQIESGLHPEHDENAREYVRECNQYIKAAAAAVGIES